MRVLLDTAVVIYAVESPEKLSRRAASALQNLDNALELSAVSVTEIAIKAAAGKLEFPAAVLRKAVDELGIRIFPFTSDHAFRLFELPVHHRGSLRSADHRTGTVRGYRDHNPRQGIRQLSRTEIDLVGTVLYPVSASPLQRDWALQRMLHRASGALGFEVCGF